MAKIKAPNSNYNGIDFGVPFVNGAAETEDTWLITMFKEKGYNVEELKTEDELEETEEMDPEPKKKAPAKKTTKEG